MSTKITSDINLLLNILPLWIREATTPHLDRLEEIAMDYYRELSITTNQGYQTIPQNVTQQDLDYVIHRVGGFKENNRAAIEGTLHRVSAIRHESKAIIGITIRIGRSVTGAADKLKAIVNNYQESLMLIGPPGVGKTTILRDITRVLAEQYGPKVIVVDTNSEIAGGGKVPVAAIGNARRMHVPEVKQQGNILMQALANHGARVIVADEIGFHDDVVIATTIARRGIKLIATVHGNSLEDVIGNPDLRPLLGDFNTTMTNRLGKPVFGTAIEIPKRNVLKLHNNLGKSVDKLLAGQCADVTEL